MSNDTKVPTSVYLYYDEHDFLVYVGITSRGMKRQREHNDTKTWWKYVARQEVEHHPSRPAAEDRERYLIQRHRPPFNTVHNPDHKASKASYLKSRSQAEAVGVPLAKIGDMKNRLGFEAVNVVGDIVTLAADISGSGIDSLGFATPKLIVSSGGRKAKLVDHGELPGGVWIRVKTGEAGACTGALVMVSGERRKNAPRAVKRIDLHF